jgi:Flp pilus assembly protein TadG
MSRRIRDERGTASLAQTVIVAPVLLFALMLIVQFGLMFHARNVAEQAAQDGAAAGRRYDGTEAAAHEQATNFLAQVVGNTLTNRSVTVQRTDQAATVTVTGTVVSVVPGLHLHVEESASGPVERYAPPADNGGAP